MAKQKERNPVKDFEYHQEVAVTDEVNTVRLRSSHELISV